MTSSWATGTPLQLSTRSESHADRWVGHQVGTTPLMCWYHVTHSSSLPNRLETLSWNDTFLDMQHLRDSFPDHSVKVGGLAQGVCVACHVTCM